jgi:hypothetical protein
MAQALLCSDCTAAVIRPKPELLKSQEVPPNEFGTSHVVHPLLLLLFCCCCCFAAAAVCPVQKLYNITLRLRQQLQLQLCRQPSFE